MFEELNKMFADYTHFYEVGMTLNEALERCARLTGDDGHVLNYGGKVIFAVKHPIGVNASEISWLTPVSGQPVDVVSE